jgi:hypothetical protein
MSEAPLYPDPVRAAVSRRLEITSARYLRDVTFFRSFMFFELPT